MRVKNHLFFIFSVLCIANTLTGCNLFKRYGKAKTSGQTVLSVYSARAPELIKPVLERYTQATGVQFSLHTDSAAKLATKLEAEGKSSNVDLFLTVDAGNLWAATEKDLLQSVESTVLDKNIPANYRDPNGKWFGMSLRARTIVFATEKTNKAELSSYAQLAESKWAGKLCLRTSKKVYNRSLVASMIWESNLKKVKQVVSGWAENLATSVFSNDTKLLQAIADPASPCAVGIVNTYYLGRLLKKNPAFPVQIFWPNQTSSGVHVNVSGIGITKHTKNKEIAVKFMEWLSGSDAQGMFADLNMEFPANPKLKASTLVQSWGDFLPSKAPLEQLGKLQLSAVKLINEAKYK